MLDGSKGLARAAREVFGGQAVVQRCVWNKREHVVAYLPKPLQPLWRATLQRAWRQPTSAAAQAELQRLHQDLRRLNEDAARSLAEGLEDTLTPHRLGVVDRLGASLATTPLEIEPRLRRLRGYRALPQLRTALRQTTRQEEEVLVV